MKKIENYYFASYIFLLILTSAFGYNFVYSGTYFLCTEEFFMNFNTERISMQEFDRIRQAVAVTAFASVLAVGAKNAASLQTPVNQNAFNEPHMTCEKEKKNTDVVTASYISNPDQSKSDVEYEELNGSVLTTVYSKQIVTLTREHHIPNVLLTAYEASEVSCGIFADGITKTGTRVSTGRTIAVDPSVIPLGSRVVINGHTYIAEDIGGKIKGHRIDIYMNTVSECMNFGVRYADVTWLEDYKAVQTVKYTFENESLIAQEVIAEEIID